MSDVAQPNSAELIAAGSATCVIRGGVLDPASFDVPLETRWLERVRSNLLQNVPDTPQKRREVGVYKMELQSYLVGAD